MATKKNFSLPHPYWTTFVAFLLIIGLIFLIRSVLSPTVMDEHAAVDEFHAIAVNGSVYIDSNRNGTKDANEQNYTGKPVPQVKLALFNAICAGPSITPMPPTGTITPTPPSGCFYRRICSMGILCRFGNHPWCPPCKTQLICPRPTLMPAQGGTTAQSGTPLVVTSHGLATGQIADSQEQQDKETTQREDVCKRIPVRVINCPVNNDGTYTCAASDVTFTDAWIKIYGPTRFLVTSKNPVPVKAATATVNFGVAPFEIFAPYRAPR